MEMSYFEANLILLAEWFRFKILNCIKHFWIIDSIMPMLPAIFDII